MFFGVRIRDKYGTGAAHKEEEEEEEEESNYNVF